MNEEGVISIPPNTYITIPGTNVQVAHDSPGVENVYVNNNTVRLPYSAAVDWYVKGIGE